MSRRSWVRVPLGADLEQKTIVKIVNEGSVDALSSLNMIRMLQWKHVVPSTNTTFLVGMYPCI